MLQFIIVIGRLWYTQHIQTNIPPVQHLIHIQTRRCIKSTKEKIRESSTNNCGPRIYIDYLIPLPVKTTDADIDPWPGGLAQQYKYAEDILKDILLGIVDESSRENCSSQIVSADDCCGLFIQESPVSPELDVAALLFPR